ncbi:hypothetical protein ACOJQI_11535 [Bacillus salacetis]|uniref:hypothetical protein n=1 Tax=Bacillus salacetis TaxID=2315464 RepID=UPI003BA0A862
MKKYLGLISLVLFILAATSYLTVFIGVDELLLFAVICSVVGMIVALFADGGSYRKFALFGNGAIILLSLVIPFVVTTFFWNSP